MNSLRTNLEIKARLRDLAAARTVAARLASAPPELQQQTDTYFQAPHGRLKLREINGSAAQLIWYARPDETAAKVSRYHLIEVANPAALRAVLDAALGVRCRVEKRREVYFYHQVRIHLDEVARLGSFLEFEAVLGTKLNEADAACQLAYLSEQFAIRQCDLVAESYVDLLAGTS